MCGIAGMYLYKRNDLQPEYFNWCLQTMMHRGPDAQSMWQNNRNYLTVFARLAIRDLSSNGDQPMPSDCKKYCISFNGEIYNTRELLQLLKPYRTEFISSSDTEVLLYALMYLGTDKTLAIADGMFAFAFYDLEKNSLVLARDRVGIKPLYVGECDEGIVFSSQYDHIINHSFFRNQPFDESVIGTYLQLGYVPANMGIVQQTKLFPHGHYMVVSETGSNTVKYFDYSIAGRKKDTKKHTDEILEYAVNSQLVSDVPVGTFMSGGVDSTLVSYFANRHTHFKAFTLGVRNSNMDETTNAKAFANKFHIDHYCKEIGAEDLISLMNDHVKAFSEPFADYSSIPTMMLSKLVRKHVTVALSGDGGDELFWGYPRNRKALDLVSFYNKPIWQRRFSLLVSKLGKSGNADISRHWKQKNFIDYYYSAMFVTGALKHLQQVYKARPQQAPDLESITAQYFEAGSDINLVMNIIRKMEMDIHLQRILLKVDRSSMFHSLEVRVPFLNNSMLDYSNCCDYTDCIKNSNGKMNLKESLIAKAGVELVMQPKKGFKIPIGDWIKNDVKKNITETILDMPSHLRFFFNMPSLHTLLEKHMNGVEDNGWFIWTIYAFIEWQNLHMNKYQHACG